MIHVDHRQQDAAPGRDASRGSKALGVSEHYFSDHISGDLHWVRRGRKRLVAITELERWLAANGERVLG